MKETYTKNNNPFDWRGKMGRMPFFLMNTFYYIVSILTVSFLCPVTMRNYSEPLLIQNRSPLEIMLANSPKNEIAIYILVILVTAILSFVLYKKRLLDIGGNGSNSLRNSLLLAGALCCLTLQLNLFTQTDSIISTILFIGFSVIYLTLLFKKGAVQQ